MHKLTIYHKKSKKSFHESNIFYVNTITNYYHYVYRGINVESTEHTVPPGQPDTVVERFKQ